MDESVIASMAQWPDVPDVHGWMSLSERGCWRLHPGADAWRAGQPCLPPFSQGESIENPQICSFIDRNYASDEHGNWYFQNGPQRVYVRLDAAPYILHTGDTPLSFQTHNGLAVKNVEHWWLDDEGRLYATTNYGAGLVSGRDLPSVAEALRTSNGIDLATALASLEPASLERFAVPGRALQLDGYSTLPAIELQAPQPSQGISAAGMAMLYFCPTAHIAERLGFVRCPDT